MTDGVFNIAKGAAAEKVRDGAATVEIDLMLLKANEAEGALIDHDDVAALLGAAGNTEADFTNYARKADIDATITIDDTNDRVDLDSADQTFTSAGNGVNNTLTKAILMFDEGGTDATRIPLTHHDFAVTTDGSDLTLEFNASGWYRAS